MNTTTPHHLEPPRGIPDPPPRPRCATNSKRRLERILADAESYEDRRARLYTEFLEQHPFPRKLRNEMAARGPATALATDMAWIIGLLILIAAIMIFSMLFG